MPRSQTVSTNDIRDPLTHRIIGCAIRVHRTLGPGLLESVYEDHLHDELEASQLSFVRQPRLPPEYEGRQLRRRLRPDFLVDGRVVVEVKAVSGSPPIFQTQLLTYLKLSGIELGLIINFHRKRLIEGVQRIILTREVPKANS
ncbi:MAG TPA: GxxExxY protein [Gemmatimonadaceae bacterium]|nr:GxxExxY protein [Gemmatimonadaceae bacterium]